MIASTRTSPTGVSSTTPSSGWSRTSPRAASERNFPSHGSANNDRPGNRERCSESRSGCNVVSAILTARASCASGVNRVADPSGIRPDSTVSMYRFEFTSVIASDARQLDEPPSPIATSASCLSWSTMMAFHFSGPSPSRAKYIVGCSVYPAPRRPSVSSSRIWYCSPSVGHR